MTLSHVCMYAKLKKNCRQLTLQFQFIVACVDDKNYADKCPEKAAIKDYCKYHSDFMQKNCPKSCGFCSSGKS